MDIVVIHICVECGYSLYAYLWILLLYISVVECGYSLFAYLWILWLYISVENESSYHMHVKETIFHAIIVTPSK